MKLQNCSVLFCVLFCSVDYEKESRVCFNSTFLLAAKGTTSVRCMAERARGNRRTAATTINDQASSENYMNHREAARGHKTNLRTFSPWSTIQFHPNQRIKSNISVGCCFTGRSRDWILNEKYKNMLHFSGDCGFDLKWLKKKAFFISAPL